MKNHIPQEKLDTLLEAHAKIYQSADPFPHGYIDNFMDENLLSKALDAFPNPTEMEFYKYDNPLEKKLAMDQLVKLPDPIQEVLMYMNSPQILQFLEKLTGIDHLVPDPYYRGGGIHQIPKGGKLDVHVDFNWHQGLQLDRRLNVLLYLNKDWKEEYGGHFEIWKGHREEKKHVLDECKTKILPIFNRLALFNTSEVSYHGHPEPLTCPEDRTRKSIALYYYTNGRPDEEKADAHSTTFIARPDDPNTPELNTLREKRNQGRLSSNINVPNIT